MDTPLFHRSAVALAVFFILYASVFAAFFAVNLPPFQNADEPSHILRAENVSRGGIVGHRLGNGQSGGLSDPAVIAAFWPFAPLLFHPEVKATRPMYEASAALRWTGALQPQNFANTAVYPPLFYLPAAVGLLAGRTAGWTILNSMTLARLLNAATFILCCGLGIALAGWAAPGLFAVLCLPMSLALMTSPAQDGTMLGCCAVVAGLSASIRRRALAPTTSVMVAVTAGLALLCMARPPYLPLAALPLLLPGCTMRARGWSMLAVTAATVGWAGFAAVYAAGVLRPDDPLIDPGGQLRWMLAHPAAAARSVLGSPVDQAGTLLEQFVGRLGWLDTPLPAFYRSVAAWLVFAALLLSIGPPGAKPHSVQRALAEPAGLVAGLIAITVLMYVIQYVTWNPIGRPFVEGVQGRYFLPLAVLAGGVLPRIPVPRRALFGRRLLIASLALFPIVSLGVTMRAVLLRYYL